MSFRLSTKISCVASKKIIIRDHSHVVDSIVFSHARADETLMKYVQKELNGGEEEKRVKTTAEKDQERKQSKDKSKSESSLPYTPQFLASASRDKTIKIFHITSGALVSEIVRYCSSNRCLLSNELPTDWP